MNKTLILFILLGGLILAQDNITLKGMVIDSLSGEPLSGVNIFHKISHSGTSTNEAGEFSVKLGSENNFPVELFCSIIGYSSKIVLINSIGIEIIIKLTPSSIKYGDVVVTASRELERIDEVSAGVELLNNKIISLQSTINNDISSVIGNEIPSLSLGTNTASNTGQTLRGRKMLILIDGIPQSTPLRQGSRDVRTITPTAIERVEVIKGATSIYGNGADGGIINYITKKNPPYKNFGAVTSISNNISLVNPENTLGSGFSQQIFGNNSGFNYLLIGSYEQTGAFRDSDGDVLSPRYGLSENEIYNLFSKFGYEYNENNKFELMYNYYSSRQHSNYTLRSGVYGEEKAVGIIGEEPGVPGGTRWNHNLNLNYFNNSIIPATSLDIDLYYQNFSTVYGYSDYFPGNGQSSLASEKSGFRANFSTKFNLNDKFHGSVIYGIDLMRDITDQKLVDGRVWVPEMDMFNIAPYIQLKTYLYDNFILKLGGRFENIGINVPDYTVLEVGYTQPYFGGWNIKGGKLDYNASVFNAGLNYIAFEPFKPYIAFSQGFSIADLGRTLRAAPEGSDAVNNIESEAVIVDNYEAGFNGKIGHLSYSGSLFLSKSELGAIYQEVNGVYVIVRSPEQVYGLEVSADYSLTPSLNLGIAYAYTEGKADANDDGSFDSEEDYYLSGDKITPPRLNLFINYSPTAKWNMHLSLNHSSERKRFEPAANGTYAYGNGPVDPFTLVHLSTSYNFGSVLLKAGIENLLNTDYYTVYSQWYGRGDTYVKGNGTNLTLGLEYSL